MKPPKKEVPKICKSPTKTMVSGCLMSGEGIQHIQQELIYRSKGIKFALVGHHQEHQHAPTCINNLTQFKHDLPMKNIPTVAMDVKPDEISNNLSCHVGFSHSTVGDIFRIAPSNKNLHESIFFLYNLKISIRNGDN